MHVAVVRELLADPYYFGRTILQIHPILGVMVALMFAAAAAKTYAILSVLFQDQEVSNPAQSGRSQTGNHSKSAPSSLTGDKAARTVRQPFVEEAFTIEQERRRVKRDIGEPNKHAAPAKLATTTVSAIIVISPSLTVMLS